MEGHLSNHQEAIANTAMGISFGGWVTSIAVDALPVVQFMAGILAIIASLFAIRFYHKRTGK